MFFRGNKERIEERCLTFSEFTSKKHTKNFTKAKNYNVNIKARVINPATPCHTAVKHKYKDFNDFKTRILKLKLGNCWNVIANEKDILLTYIEEENFTPKYDIYVDFSLGFSVRVYCWFLNDDHFLYKQYKRSFFNMTSSAIINELQTLNLCKGVSKQSILKDKSSRKRFSIKNTLNVITQIENIHKSFWDHLLVKCF